MSRRDLRVSVVIATYNAADLLAETLGHLTRQTLPSTAFEVIVGDDGSSDGTEAVVRSFADRLQIKYYFQEDRGFRAGAARNGAARLAAAPLLVFLDTGHFPGPGFLQAHLAAHPPGRPRRAVIGPSWGYNPPAPMEGLAAIVESMTPQDAVAAYRDVPAFQDIRQPALEAVGFDMTKLLVPWQIFWAANCSVHADDFRRTGGFDETFHGWGGEDQDLGYRLHKLGLTFHYTDDAWNLAYPHGRDHPANERTFEANTRMITAKLPEPPLELGYGLMIGKDEYWPWEEEYRAFVRWRDEVRGTDVADEIAKAVADLADGERIAVFGSGGVLPAGLDSAVLVEFDQELLDRALETGDHSGYWAIGIKTTLADDTVDTVVITSRLAGLWESWGELILAEARRVGDRVRVFDGAAG
ncbi:glycosyltransferase [Actinacidiphila sp. DG2A-62]|uniref:glycosyltransferase n=1 Tax=Actinacidiphila sp. DG2A-62 TaxID=3108821 RepID=UPI002DB813BB|nr:glycosyltransferase [Actinacidiphila sp. DG2A-62]MEC3992633.1 glycosyltransferase [Actinacidiphila sp. DG2A-62]